MEGKNQLGSSFSSSSFTNDLFGSKENSSLSSSFTNDLFGSKENENSSSVFSSLFGPSKAFDKESRGKEASENNQATAKFASKSEVWKNDKEETKELESSYYYEQRIYPCHLSSSIYYGGQDYFLPPPKTSQSGYSTVGKKDGEDDDSDAACRGNWWQGSLYY